MSDLLTRLESRKAQIQADFDKLNAEWEELKKKGAEINQRMAQIKTTVDKLDGAMIQVLDLIKENTPIIESGTPTTNTIQ